MGLCVRAMAGLSLVLMLSVPTLQAAVYKWTDEAGQVHYGQELPAGVQREGAEVVPLDTRTPAAPPAQVGTGQGSCGSVALPASAPDPVTNILRLRLAIATWQKSIAENSARTDAEALQWLADRRCAIELANRELQGLSEVEQGIESNYERARAELDELQQRLTECDDPNPDDDGLSAAACRQQYEHRLKPLKTMLRELERQKNMLELSR